MCCACEGEETTTSEELAVEETTTSEETETTTTTSPVPQYSPVPIQDLPFTLDEFEVAIEVIDTIKSDLVTGDSKPISNLNHLANFIDWTEEFQIPYAYG